jgi:preprotein translocase subunit SecE
MKNLNIVTYFKGVWAELKKVSWPTGKQVVDHTIIVLVSAAIAIALTAAVDFGLTKLVEYLVQNRG